MSVREQHLEQARTQPHDLIVVGGGIYGMTLTLEAARRGLKPLLLERDDFGGAVSHHSMRILHGGLRYLQSMDLARFFESVGERRWFLRHFSPLCRVLPCLLPLYGRGLKRPSVFAAATRLNDLLSCRRNRGVPEAVHLPAARVLSVTETIARFPLVPREGLQGAALWHDGQMVACERIHAELLRWAAARGATLVNHVEVLGLERNGSRAAGVVTTRGTFLAPLVINCAGPWCREVSQRLDSEKQELMQPLLTFNVMLNKQPPSDAAVAVQAPQKGARLFFIPPHQGRAFSGTMHVPFQGSHQPTRQDVQQFLDELNEALPGFNATTDDIVRITPGVLPRDANDPLEMAGRPTFVQHDVTGLFSLCGVKYTTARYVGEQALRRMYGPALRPGDDSTPQFDGRESWSDARVMATLDDAELRRVMDEEWVAQPEDLLLRRMEAMLSPQENLQLLRRVAALMGVTPAWEKLKNLREIWPQLLPWEALP